MTAENPALQKPFTVLLTFNSFPYPVSPSPMIGIFTFSHIFLPCSIISPYEISPVSGRPSFVAEVAKPLIKLSSNPACSIIFAERAS